jgi:hypothetical protein
VGRPSVAGASAACRFLASALSMASMTLPLTPASLSAVSSLIETSKAVELPSIRATITPSVKPSRVILMMSSLVSFCGAC